MKIVAQYPKGFRPITLTVTIETLNELYNLFARLNMSTADVNKAVEKHGWNQDIKHAVSVDSNLLLHELLKYMPEDVDR